LLSPFCARIEGLRGRGKIRILLIFLAHERARKKRRSTNQHGLSDESDWSDKSDKSDKSENPH